MKTDGSVMMFHGVISCWRRNWLSSPAPPIICWNRVMTSTQEKKCGISVTDWTRPRIRGLSTELSSSASATGTGKNSTSWTAASSRVFHTDPQNSGSPNSWRKLSRPIHWLFTTPTMGS